MDYSLQLKIDNKKPLELNELTNSLNSLAKEYDCFAKEEFGLSRTDRKLEIKSLKEGSLIIDLCSIAIPVMQDANVIFKFGEHLINALNYFVGKNNTKQSYSKRTCDNLNNLINLIANDNGSNINISINGNDNTTPILIGNYDDIACNAAQNKINKYRESLLEEEPLVQRKQAFYWISASFFDNKDEFSKSNNSSDKGIIEKIDKNPRKVIFENDSDKILITKYNTDYQKDWQELVYIVDVEVIKIQDVVKTYKILKIYPDDTFDPKEDS